MPFSHIKAISTIRKNQINGKFNYFLVNLSHFISMHTEKKRQLLKYYKNPFHFTLKLEGGR